MGVTAVVALPISKAAETCATHSSPKISRSVVVLDDEGVEEPPATKRLKTSPIVKHQTMSDTSVCGNDNTLVSSVQDVICPICNKVLNSTNTTYTVINLHVDMCMKKKYGNENSIYNRYFA